MIIFWIWLVPFTTLNCHCVVRKPSLMGSWSSLAPKPQLHPASPTHNPQLVNNGNSMQTTRSPGRYAPDRFEERLFMGINLATAPRELFVDPAVHSLFMVYLFNWSARGCAAGRIVGSDRQILRQQDMYSRRSAGPGTAISHDFYL